MQKLISFSLLVVLVSCTSSRLERKIDNVAWDALADESFMRWGEKRLKENSGLQPKVVKCYQGKSKETLQSFKKDYLTRDQNPYYWLHVGNCFFVQDKWSKAEFFYRMALEENKAPMIRSIALNNLGLISFKHEQWEKGKDYLRQSSALAPKFKVPRYNISQLYLQFGLYDRAIEVLNDPLFKGQQDVDIYFSLANAYLFKGDLKNSGAYFKLIPKENYRREDIAATYALYLVKTGKYDKAKEIIEDRDRSGVTELAAISHKIEKMIATKLAQE